MHLGRLPESPFEVRLAATLFLLVLGVADVFGAMQVASFASFTPAGVARTVAGRPDQPGAGPGSTSGSTVATETPINLADLDRTEHHIHRELLVQDTHVHLPAYAMTAALLAVIVLGLRLPSRGRSALIALAFAAPFADFTGLWGAHLFPGVGVAFGTLAVAGGFAMGLAYLAVLALTLSQCWLTGAKE
jgi:hypothetical protein